MPSVSLLDQQAGLVVRPSDPFVVVVVIGLRLLVLLRVRRMSPLPVSAVVSMPDLRAARLAWTGGLQARARNVASPPTTHTPRSATIGHDSAQKSTPRRAPDRAGSAGSGRVKYPACASCYATPNRDWGRLCRQKRGVTQARLASASPPPPPRAGAPSSLAAALRKERFSATSKTAERSQRALLNESVAVLLD